MSERLQLLEKIAEREAFLRARVSPWDPADGWSSEIEYLRDIDSELDRLYRKLDALGEDDEPADEMESVAAPSLSYDFKAGENPADLFSEAVAKLTAFNIEPSFRCSYAKDLTDTYVDQVGERPDPGELDELANWIIFGPTGLSVKKRKQQRLIKAKEAHHG